MYGSLIEISCAATLLVNYAAQNKLLIVCSDHALFHRNTVDRTIRTDDQPKHVELKWCCTKCLSTLILDDKSGPRGSLQSAWCWAFSIVASPSPWDPALKMRRRFQQRIRPPQRIKSWQYEAPGQPEVPDRPGNGSSCRTSHGD